MKGRPCFRQQRDGETGGQKSVDDGLVAVATGRVKRRCFRFGNFSTFPFGLNLVGFHEFGMRLEEDFHRFQSAVLGSEIEGRLVAYVAVAGVGAILEQEANDASVSVLGAAV